MNIEPQIAAFGAELKAIRRDIHAHPELGFEEERTSAIVAQKLKEWGLEVTTGIGKTGVVGTIRVGNNPRAIGLRADMDALPMDELNTFDHRSTHKGRMHACGHDGHTTMLLGAAKYLSATRNFDGTVHLIFQPAEEGRGGAEAMVKDGLFEKFPCEQIFGMHNRPKLDVGKFAIRPGPQMAGGGLFDIHITGKGTHGARPEAGIDPVIIATQIISALQTVVSRNVAPLDSAVISVTQMHAGDAYNVVPQEAILRGTIRAFRKETMALVKERIETISAGIAQTLGGSAKADIRVAFPPLVNDKDAVKFIADVAAKIVGEENMNRDGMFSMASEDFSYMLEKVPGAFINIGNGSGEGGCEVHNPSYDFNDDILTLGATLWSRVVETKLAKDAPVTTNDTRHWLLKDLPYAAMLALAVGGLVLTSFRGPTTYYYWMALAPIYGLICVVSGWRHLDTGAGHMQLAVTQALHWLAFVGAMWLMFLPEVRGIDSDNATSLTLLILLALGTFVAGVHARVWRICAVGVFLAAAVPAVAWVQESAMLLLVGALLVVAVGLFFWWMWRRESGRA